jgi:hypothetical protein
VVGALFEGNDEDNDDDDHNEKKKVVSQKSQAKIQLLALLGEINRDSEQHPCGLKSKD